MSADVLDFVDQRPLGVPTRLQDRVLRFEGLDALPEDAELPVIGPQAGGKVSLQRGNLDVQMIESALQVVEGRRTGILRHLDPRGRRIHQVDGFVGELATGDKAIRQEGRRPGCLRGNVDVVVRFVLRLDPLKHDRCHLRRRLVDRDELKPALQGGVFLDILLVLRPRRRGNRSQLPAGKGGLEEVCRVSSARFPAGPDQRVRFIDEKKRRPGSFPDVLDDGLQATLEFALDPGACL